MTNAEHILKWIENSHSQYPVLCQLSRYAVTDRPVVMLTFAARLISYSYTWMRSINEIEECSREDLAEAIRLALNWEHPE